MQAILAAITVALGLLTGHHGDDAAGRPVASLPQQAALEAARDLDTALRGEGASCARKPPRRGFRCVLPSLEGIVELELVATGDGYAIRGCEHPGRRCVFDPRRVRRPGEAATPAESHAAKRLEFFGGISDAVCSQTGRRLFECDANFAEAGIGAAVNVELTISERGYYFIDRCRTTRIRIRSPLGCQHMWWNVNQMNGTLEALATEAARNR